MPLRFISDNATSCHPEASEMEIMQFTLVVVIVVVIVVVVIIIDVNLCDVTVYLATPKQQQQLAQDVVAPLELVTPDVSVDVVERHFTVGDCGLAGTNPIKLFRCFKQ